jgi:CheY-like chemotaxis protein
VAEVLLVEDNPGDVRLVREALRHCRAAARLSAVADGDLALARLRSSREPPRLVLLDLNLTRVDGRTVLAAMRRDPALASVPIVILSSSDAERDVRMAHELGASDYVKKPSELDEFLAAVARAVDRWLTPREPDPGNSSEAQSPIP